jgi:hypothetical protein
MEGSRTTSPPVVQLAMASARGAVGLVLGLGAVLVLVELAFGGTHTHLTLAFLGAALVLTMWNLLDLKRGAPSVVAILRSARLVGAIIAMLLGWGGWTVLLISGEQRRYAEFAPVLIPLGTAVFFFSWFLFVRLRAGHFRVECLAILDPAHGPPERAEALFRLLNGPAMNGAKSTLSAWGPVATIVGMGAPLLLGRGTVSALLFIFLTMILCPGLLGATAGFWTLQGRYRLIGGKRARAA